MVVCNPTGRAEHLSLTAEYGMQSRSQFQATLGRRWLRQLPWPGSVSLLQNSSDWKPQSSYTELLRGMLLRLQRCVFVLIVAHLIMRLIEGLICV